MAGIAGSIERAVFTEEHARKRRLAAARRPAGQARHVPGRGPGGQPLDLAGRCWSPCTRLILLAARASRVPFDFFVRRVWLGIPFFAGVVILPSIFLAPGPRLFDWPLGPLHLAPSIPGLAGAVVFVARVGVSVSLAVLLVLTTPWADLLKSLQALRVPQVFILLLSMTYRYIFLFLHTINGMFEARKSRMVGRDQRGRAARLDHRLDDERCMNRSFKMSNDVYAAMLARGFTGAVRSYNAYRMRAADWLALLAALVVAAAALPLGGMLG